MTGYAVAVSEHPVPASATGEVVGSILEQLGPQPDLAVLLVSSAHAGAVDDVTATVRAVLRPRRLVGCVAPSLIAGDREIEEQPAIVLWAGPVGPTVPVALDVVTTAEGTILGGLPEGDLDGAVLLLLADPFSFPASAVLDALAERHPSWRVVGGLAAGASAPGFNRLLLDGAVRTSGAVGVILQETAGVVPVVSQGCHPIGEPLTVTAARGNVIEQIAGRPAVARLEEALAGLPPEQLARARNGLHVGRVADEHQAEFGPGDFLIRNILAGDRATGSITVGDTVAVGETVQFQLRDAATADQDLRLLLDQHRAEAALVFTCNGRGRRLFGEPDHDARVITESIGSASVAGMFCAGEIGPVGPRSFVHGFTASVLLFGHRGP